MSSNQIAHLPFNSINCYYQFAIYWFYVIYLYHFKFLFNQSMKLVMDFQDLYIF